MVGRMNKRLTYIPPLKNPAIITSIATMVKTEPVKSKSFNVSRFLITCRNSLAVPTVNMIFAIVNMYSEFIAITSPFHLFSRLTASTKLSFSIAMTNCMTFPALPQAKHRHRFVLWFTDRLGTASS
jgi:hypothetical protein